MSNARTGHDQSEQRPRRAHWPAPHDPKRPPIILRYNLRALSCTSILSPRAGLIGQLPGAWGSFCRKPVRTSFPIQVREIYRYMKVDYDRSIVMLAAASFSYLITGVSLIGMITVGASGELPRLWPNSPVQARGSQALFRSLGRSA